MEACVLREPSRGLPLCFMTFLMASHLAEVSPAVGPGRGSEGRQPGTETQPELLAWGPQGIVGAHLPQPGESGVSRVPKLTVGERNGNLGLGDLCPVGLERRFQLLRTENLA